MSSSPAASKSDLVTPQLGIWQCTPVALGIRSQSLSWFSKFSKSNPKSNLKSCSKSLALLRNPTVPSRLSSGVNSVLFSLNLGDIRSFIQPDVLRPRHRAGWRTQGGAAGSAFQIRSTGSAPACWLSSRSCLCCFCRCPWASSSSACSTD